MDYDQDKVDEMVLALLWLTQTGDGRAWKGHDWVAMDRLAGGPGLIQRFIQLRVPPVPRFWGPGRRTRTAGSASTRAVGGWPRSQ
jgi:hypothetical protein